jgi:hypothetical protein
MYEAQEDDASWIESVKQWLLVSLLFDLCVVAVVWASIGTEQMAWHFCQVVWVDACDEVFGEDSRP